MEYEFEVHIDGEYYATACGADECKALAEAMHYAYTAADDGVEVEVYEVIRTKISEYQANRRMGIAL